MINEIINKLQDKKIAILGFGVEGKSTYKFIRKYLPEIELTIIDCKDKSNEEICKGDSNLSFVSGPDYFNDLDKYDWIIKSPGISFKDIDVSSFKEKITSQIELLLEVDRENIIGITGTKGKSTTTSLIYEMIKDQGKDVILVGNIGIPALDEIENFNENTIIVAEMSSHQLEFIETSPHIALLLNLYQDHLDHDGTLDHYHNNKMNIFRYQTEEDICFYSSDNPYTIKKLSEYDYKAEKYDISFDNNKSTDHSVRISKPNVYLGDKLIYTDGERKLIGDHYLKDIMFVVALADILGLDLNKVKETIKNFKPLEYRLEDMGIIDGINYYVDTIATIPEATMEAVKALPNIDTLILGGEDRKTDYDHFIEFLNNNPTSKNIRNIICMYGTGERIYPELNKEGRNVWYTNELKEAVELAKENTAQNKICLLSPAASSKDYFIDYREKGKYFKCLVTNQETDIKEHRK
jgi:UDP-N-acetylmuramoylalanine--D-glutamate ligase